MPNRLDKSCINQLLAGWWLPSGVEISGRQPDCCDVVLSSGRPDCCAVSEIKGAPCARGA